MTPYTNGAGLHGFERFFFMAAFLKQSGLTNVVQVECDNHVYTDVVAMIPKMAALYPHLATTPCGMAFDTASIMFIKDYASLEHMNALAVAWSSFTDATVAAVMPPDSGIPTSVADWGAARSEMQFLGYYRLVFGERRLGELPVLPFGRFARNFDDFGFVFDPARFARIAKERGNQKKKRLF